MHTENGVQKMANNLFFYGSLRDNDLLELVVDHSSKQMKLTPAYAQDHRAISLLGESYPILIASEGDTAEGLLATNISGEDVARLSYFEDDDYVLSPITITTDEGEVEAQVFLGTERIHGVLIDWSFESFQENDKNLLMECSREHMGYFGKLPALDIEAKWASIKARAEARLNGKKPLQNSMTQPHTNVINQQDSYDLYFKVTDCQLQFRLFDGGFSDVVTRSAFVSGDAVTLLPYDPVLDKVLLIEQWRAGPFLNGDPNPWTIEVIAGRIDQTGSPAQTAVREAKEEANITVTRIDEMQGYYSTPGIAAEYITAFIGKADLANAGGVHGLPEEAEDIRVIVLDYADAMSALDRGEINSGPAALALLWLSRHREYIRNLWLGTA